MMIDTKKFEELCCKRTELAAEYKVLTQIGEFIKANATKSLGDRNFYELRVWSDLMGECSNRLGDLNNRYDQAIKELEKLKEEA